MPIPGHFRSARDDDDRDDRGFEYSSPADAYAGCASMIQDRRRAVRFGLALIGLMAAIIIGDELRIFGEPPAPIQNEEFMDVGNGCPRHHPHLRLVADYTSAKFCTTEDCMAKMKCPVD